MTCPLFLPERQYTIFGYAPEAEFSSPKRSSRYPHAQWIFFIFFFLLAPAGPDSGNV